MYFKNKELPCFCLSTYSIFKEHSQHMRGNPRALNIGISDFSTCDANKALRRNRRRANAAIASGGARRDRTADLLRARQALSQLSYSPKGVMVGLGGFEPPTSPLSGVRSNQLSYKPWARFTRSLYAEERSGKSTSRLIHHKLPGFDYSKIDQCVLRCWSTEI